MKPIDHRNETWEALQERVQGLRLAVLDAWRAHGPGTTREVARRSGIDLLTFRPRTTELVQLGLVQLVPTTQHLGREGIYRALDPAEALSVFADRKASAFGGPIQAQLALK